MYYIVLPSCPTSYKERSQRMTTRQDLSWDLFWPPCLQFERFTYCPVDYFYYLDKCQEMVWNNNWWICSRLNAGLYWVCEKAIHMYKIHYVFDPFGIKMKGNIATDINTIDNRLAGSFQLNGSAIINSSLQTLLNCHLSPEAFYVFLLFSSALFSVHHHTDGWHGSSDDSFKVS